MTSALQRPYPRERLWTDCEEQLQALLHVLAPLVAAVVLNPLTDDDERAEIQRRWAALNTPRTD